MSIKNKIINFITRHRLLTFALLLAFILPGLTNAAGDVQVRMISDGEAYLVNTVTGTKMSANKMVGPNGQTYFCVSKGLRGPDYLGAKGSYGTFSSPVKMNDMAKKVLLLGYPNRNINVGFSGVEQYHITQIAFWATVTDYDLVNAPQMRHSSVENLKVNKGYPAAPYVLEAVKNLYYQAQNTDIATFNPSATVTGAMVAKLQGSNMVAGPFTVAGQNLQSASFRLSATGANGVQFLNSNNQVVTTVGLGDKFFVSIPKSNNASNGSVKITLAGTGKYLEGLIYKAPRGNMQDMATLEPVDIQLPLATSATWDNPTNGQVEVTKTDSKTGKVLAGAKIAVFNSAGTKVFEGTTNAQGKLLSSQLALGKYTYKEESAPSGYKLNQTVSSFSLTADGQVIKVSLTNDPIPDTPIKIKKVDSVTKASLKGAKITVLNSSNTAVFTGLTDANGVANVGALKAGSYTYKELEAPAGYQVNTKTFSFKIAAGDAEKVFTMENTPVKKINVCRLSDYQVVTIEEAKFNEKEYSKNLQDCNNNEKQVCRLSDHKIISIKEREFDKKLHTEDLEECAPLIKVCKMDNKEVIEIKEKDFNGKIHSKNLDDCKDDIQVCDLNTKKVITIKVDKYDETKHSKNLEDCKIEVCLLSTKEIIKIDSSEFDESRHSHNKADCQETPPELPHTGPLETAAALIAVTAVTMSVVYWYKSAQAVKRSK